MTEAVILAKLPVLPVSVMVVDVGSDDGGAVGGPSGDSKLVHGGLAITVVFNLIMLLLGCPRP